VTTSPITRAGIVAKHGLAASGSPRSAGDLAAETRGSTRSSKRRPRALATRSGRTWSRDELPNHVDLIIVLGGDGTLLSMATRIARTGHDVPMLGVNFGSLGFLTETRIDELYGTLESILAGTATFDERALLSRRGVSRREFVRLARRPERRRLHEGGAVAHHRAVGVGEHRPRHQGQGRRPDRGERDRINGVQPRSGAQSCIRASIALVLTPIAPHTLTHRPVVIPGTEVVEVRPLPDAGAEDIYVTYDGQSGYPLQKGDSIRICKHPRTLRLVKAPARSYFEVLREKLKWGER
jgi:NAD+ kinase